MHVADGFYYIILSSNAQRHIFTHENDYADFERFLANALERCHVHIHAFTWQTDSARLVVQIADILVGRFVQRLASRYARNVHRQRGGSGHLFQQRYHALFIDHHTYLLRLIHHVHLLPLAAGALNGIDPNRLSSHGAYLGLTDIPWLTTDVVLGMLARPDKRAHEAYVELMKMPADLMDAKAFEDRRRRFLVPKPFVFPPLRRRSEKCPTLNQTIDAVSLRLGVEPQLVLSKSRRRQLTLARALITWVATKIGIASLADVGRKLSRDPSTLCAAMARYVEQRPDLFNEEIIREL
jgi:putative transposase